MPINKVARASIEELRSRYGITDLTPDEVLELNDLGAAMLAAGKPRDAEARAASPVRVGNVLLHPLTCAAEDFIERLADAKIPAKLHPYFMPFAMAHGREPERLAEVDTEGQLAAALRRFRRECSATGRELDEAAADLLAIENAAPDGITSLRNALLSVCAWVSAWDSHLADSFRDVCLDRLKDAHEELERKNPRGTVFWRRLCVELGALTGLSPEYWYSEDHELVLVAWRRVLEREVRGFGDAGEKYALTEATAAQRKAMARIVERRMKPGNGDPSHE